MGDMELKGLVPKPPDDIELKGLELKPRENGENAELDRLPEKLFPHILLNGIEDDCALLAAHGLAVASREYIAGLCLKP